MHFLRLIVERQLDPGEAVRAYHAVLLTTGNSAPPEARRRSATDRPGHELRGKARASVTKTTAGDSAASTSRASVPNNSLTAVAGGGMRLPFARGKNKHKLRKRRRRGFLRAPGRNGVIVRCLTASPSSQTQPAISS